MYRVLNHKNRTHITLNHFSIIPAVMLCTVQHYILVCYSSSVSPDIYLTDTNIRHHSLEEICLMVLLQKLELNQS